jgi:hypothetical protein
MAHTIYKIKKNVVPSVTTVLGRYKDSQGLLYWANSIGLKGISYSKYMKEVGNIGTNVHELAQCFIEGLEFSIPKDDEVVINCFNKFLMWWESFQSDDFEVIFCEQSFTSKKFVLVDFKTSKSIYSDYIVQGSAYREMIREKYNYDISKFVVARFGKESDDFEIKEYNKDILDEAFNYFKIIRKAFDQDKKLTKLIKEIK